MAIRPHEALSQRVVIGQGISEEEPLTKIDSLGEFYRGGLWASGGWGRGEGKWLREGGRGGNEEASMACFTIC